MTAEQARREMEGSYEGSDVDEEDEMGRGEVIHRHQNQTRYNPMNSVLEVRSSQRTIESADEQPAKKPTPKRLSSAKIAAIFKNKYDTTEDPRRLPKHKRGPHSLRRKRVQAEPEPVYSEDEFRPEALPKADRKSKVIETEKKLTRYQRKMLEPADSQESHESQASSEKQPKVEQQTVPKKRTTKQTQKAKPQPVKQLPVPQPQVKKFVWVNPYLIQINKADLLSSQELHKLDASTKPAPTVDKKVSQVSQAERSEQHTEPKREARTINKGEQGVCPERSDSDEDEVDRRINDLRHKGTIVIEPYRPESLLSSVEVHPDDELT